MFSWPPWPPLALFHWMLCRCEIMRGLCWQNACFCKSDARFLGYFLCHPALPRTARVSFFHRFRAPSQRLSAVLWLSSLCAEAVTPLHCPIQDPGAGDKRRIPVGLNWAGQKLRPFFLALRPSSDSSDGQPPQAPQPTDFQGKSGGPRAIRTPDPQIRSLMLYPAELWIHSCGCI